MEQAEEIPKDELSNSPPQKEEQPSLEDIKGSAEEEKVSSVPDETHKDMPEQQEAQDEDQDDGQLVDTPEANEEFKQEEGEQPGKNFAMPKTFEVEIHMDDNQVTPASNARSEW